MILEALQNNNMEFDRSSKQQRQQSDRSQGNSFLEQLQSFSSDQNYNSHDSRRTNSSSNEYNTSQAESLSKSEKEQQIAKLDLSEEDLAKLKKLLGSNSELSIEDLEELLKSLEEFYQLLASLDLDLLDLEAIDSEVLEELEEFKDLAFSLLKDLNQELDSLLEKSDSEGGQMLGQRLISGDHALFEELAQQGKQESAQGVLFSLAELQALLKEAQEESLFSQELLADSSEESLSLKELLAISAEDSQAIKELLAKQGEDAQALKELLAQQGEDSLDLLELLAAKEEGGESLREALAALGELEELQQQLQELLKEYGLSEEQLEVNRGEAEDSFRLHQQFFEEGNNYRPLNDEAPLSQLELESSLAEQNFTFQDFESLASLEDLMEAINSEQSSSSFKEILTVDNSNKHLVNNEELLMAKESLINNNQALTSNQLLAANTSNLSLVNQTAIIEQIQAQLAQLNSLGANELVLNLEPEFLGKLSMSVSLDEGVLTARFLAESKQVRDLLQKNMPQLRSMLAEKQIQVDEVIVDVDPQLGQEGDTGSSGNMAFQDFNSDSQQSFLGTRSFKEAEEAEEEATVTETETVSSTEDILDSVDYVI